MRNDELVELLRTADRTPAWLARRLGVSRTSVVRWMKGEQAVPVQRAGPIRYLLRSVPTVTTTTGDER